jgi:RNA polymerase sigma factor (sigma-70 family)
MATGTGTDALLGAYLLAEDAVSVESALSDLIGGQAEPIVRRVVSSRMAGLSADIDDVCSEARLELLLHLRRVKEGRSSGAIGDFRAYTATIAGNAANRYFRRKQRQLTTSLEEDAVPEGGVAEEPGTALDRRRFVARLWEEIQILPRQQRVALLLNLRDRHGNSVLFLFPLCGVASFAGIASALELSEDELVRLWNDLPADDNSIGALLGCARQRVINLRMAGRKRLTNRLGGRQ